MQRSDPTKAVSYGLMDGEEAGMLRCQNGLPIEGLAGNLLWDRSFQSSTCWMLGGNGSGRDKSTGLDSEWLASSSPGAVGRRVYSTRVAWHVRWLVYHRLFYATTFHVLSWDYDTEICQMTHQAGNPHPRRPHQMTHQARSTSWPWMKLA